MWFLKLRSFWSGFFVLVARGTVTKNQEKRGNFVKVPIMSLVCIILWPKTASPFVQDNVVNVSGSIWLLWPKAVGDYKEVFRYLHLDWHVWAFDVLPVVFWWSPDKCHTQQWATLLHDIVWSLYYCKGMFHCEYATLAVQEIHFIFLNWLQGRGSSDWNTPIMIWQRPVL